MKTRKSIRKSVWRYADRHHKDLHATMEHGRDAPYMVVSGIAASGLGRPIHWLLMQFILREKLRQELTGEYRTTAP